MAEVFFSYAHQDQERIRPLVIALEQQGVSVFWDRRIPAGKTWRTHIGEALAEAKCVIVAWSQHSVASAWVSEEADEARKRGVLIPILLDCVDPPMGFRSIQAADLTRWSGGDQSLHFLQLLEDIQVMLHHTTTPLATNVDAATTTLRSLMTPAVAMFSLAILALLAGVAHFLIKEKDDVKKTVMPVQMEILPKPTGEFSGKQDASSTEAEKGASQSKTKQKSAHQDLPAGHITVFDGFKDYTRSGFNFATGTLVSWNSGKADILVSNHQQPEPSAFLFAQNETLDYSSAPQDKGANAGIREMAGIQFDDLKECPATGYRAHWVKAAADGVYCVRSRDGNHFAKIVLSDVEIDRIAFDWVYQPDGTRRFE